MIDFAKNKGLVPAIIQDANNRAVLMMGYMNEESLKKTRETGLVTFFSRSRKTLWTKGETSGNYLKLVSIKEDCDHDTLLIRAIPTGPVCHLGTDTCWGNIVIITQCEFRDLETIIQDRFDHPSEKSYSASLLRKGLKKIAQKVGEEGLEVALEGVGKEDELLLNESADLVYHLLVLLKARGYSLADVSNILRDRHVEQIS